LLKDVSGSRERAGPRVILDWLGSVWVIIPGVEVDDGRLADIRDRYGIAELQIFGSQASLH